MESIGANQLFELLRQYVAQPTTTICMLHFAEKKTPCPKSNYFCGKESEKMVVNFDTVKNMYCLQEKIGDPWPSVDAVLNKDKTFLFVEIKGWQNFERFQLKDIENEDEKKLRVEEQVKKYNLKQKIEKSMDICRNLSHDPQVFDSMPIIYVLVTDVDTILDPLVRLRAQLGILSYKAVNIPLYTNAVVNELNGMGMIIRYKTCRKFDEFYDSL